MAAAAVASMGGDSGQREVTATAEAAALRAELQLATEQLARERRRREKLTGQVARQQTQLQELESLVGDAADAADARQSAEALRAENSRLAAEAAEQRELAERLRHRLEAEAARRDEELRQLTAQYAEDDAAAKDALTKMAVSLESEKMENANLRQMLSHERQQGTELRAETERLRTDLAEASVSAAESERAWHAWADKQDGANRLREMRDANIRLQEKLAGAESRLDGLRADCQAAATLAEERGELVARLREQLAACEARAAALLEAQTALAAAKAPSSAPATHAAAVRDPDAVDDASPHQLPRASEKQLAAICQQLERAEATGRSRKMALETAAAAADAAADGRTPSSAGFPAPPLSLLNPPVKISVGVSTESEGVADSTAALAATREELASARSELALVRADLAMTRDANADLLGRISALRNRRPAEGIAADDPRFGGCRDADAARKWRVAGAGNGSGIGYRADPSLSGLWRTSCCTDDLEGLRRACLSLAAERDRLSGDCRHYRGLYEAEQRLRRRLTDEVRRLNCGDARAQALLQMQAETGNHLQAAAPAGDLEIATYSAYLRHRYTLT